MPKVLTMGKNSGVKMRMAGVTSMKVPATSRITFMMSRIRMGLVVTPSRASEIAWGIWVKAMTQPRILDTPMRKTTMPLSTTMFQKDLRVMLR